MSIESVMPSSHLILCRPLLLLPSIPPSIRVFSNESTLRMRWPKYWSFSFSIGPSIEGIGSNNFRGQRNFVSHCHQFSIPLEIFHREGDGTPLQYSCLENPMNRGAWCTAVQGVAKSRTRLSDFTFTFHFHALEKEMATHSSVLAWIPETGKPGGLPSMGSHRVGHDWSDLAVAAAEIFQAVFLADGYLASA